MGYLEKSPHPISGTIKQQRTTPKLAIYGTKAWRQQTRPEALRRANYACAYCGDISDSNEAHHTVDPREHPEASFDLNCIEIRCKSCHSKLTMAENRRQGKL